ncbi:MAG TPA: hypothetical protein VN541_13375 [Tepidisphaeraceae bacterium]|nr:hypothetical protein [Tepidisphaeraceae bacterium]
MQLAALQRWHWIVIALVVGLGIGLAQDAFDSGVGGMYVNGELILTDQHAFEDALVQEYNGSRLFLNATIYTHQIKDTHGNKKLVDVVQGSYWNKEPEPGKNYGLYHYRSFVAYRPYKPFVGIPGPNGAAPVAEYPSVGDFLAAMHRAYGVNYRYAWWAPPAVLTWLIGSLVVIGGIWPTLINLLTFGTFTRPPEAKGISLWKVRLPKPAAGPVPATTNAAPPGELEEVEGTPDLTAAPVAQEEESAEAAIARVLEGGPLELGPEPEKEAHEYSAKPDDYYPTERRVRPSNSQSQH